nr:MAG TPA: Putative vitamin uptake transporter [Caudoviricetes sp.]
MKSVLRKIKRELDDYRLLLRSVPAIAVVGFTVSVILMNFMANKVIFRFGDYAAADGGLLISWIPFLSMDVIVKRYGTKAANKINIFAVAVNLLCVGVLALVSALPGDGGDYSAFNATFSCTWFILLGSVVAIIISGLVNNATNKAISKMFTDETSKIAYVTSSYVSTFIAQFVDNFVFAVIVYVVFGPMYWEGFEPFTLLTCVGCGLVGACLELVMEVVFSPIGFRVLKRWERDQVGADYLNSLEEKE